ncbi:unnamed protein product [Effrenium voratum]|nr:unnamed protein product [Effrenium voratum]
MLAARKCWIGFRVAFCVAFIAAACALHLLLCEQRVGVGTFGLVLSLLFALPADLEAACDSIMQGCVTLGALRRLKGTSHLVHELDRPKLTRHGQELQDELGPVLRCDGDGLQLLGKRARRLFQLEDSEEDYHIVSVNGVAFDAEAMVDELQTEGDRIFLEFRCTTGPKTSPGNGRREIAMEARDAKGKKAKTLICSSFAEGRGPTLATELEEVLSQAATSLGDYRARVRTLVAALRRGDEVRARLLSGDLQPSLLVEEGPQVLLTDQQRAARAKVQKESLERCLRTSFGGLGYFLLGIDCNGRDCSLDCERRHLEPREQQRGDWPRLKTSHLVICAGPERSGSTWLFNAIRLLHLKAQMPCDSYWLRRLSREKLAERLRAQPPAVVLVKTHEWFADYAEFIDMAKNILLTHRDLRGVVASYRRVKWEVAIPDAYVSEHMQWRTRCTLDLAYEHFMRDAVTSLQKVAEHLAIDVSKDQLTEVDTELRELKRSHCGNAVCQVTKLWPDHRSAESRQLESAPGGASNQQLNKLKDPEYEQVLNSRFKEYQTTYGYI